MTVSRRLAVGRAVMTDRPLHSGELWPARPRWPGLKASVDDEFAAGDPGGIVAGEEESHVGYVGGLADPSEYL